MYDGPAVENQPRITKIEAVLFKVLPSFYFIPFEHDSIV